MSGQSHGDMSDMEQVLSVSGGETINNLAEFDRGTAPKTKRPEAKQQAGIDQAPGAESAGTEVRFSSRLHPRWPGPAALVILVLHSA